MTALVERWLEKYREFGAHNHRRVDPEGLASVGRGCN